MAASDYLSPDQHNPVQLPMFMRARDVRSSITGTMDRSFTDVDEVLEQKLAESKGPRRIHGGGVYNAIEREGVQNPVQLVHGVDNNLMIGQGHHRLAAADDISYETGRDMWMPLVHTDATERSQSPVGPLSEMEDKKGAIADYRKWSENTTAIGHDASWMAARERAPKKSKPRPKISREQAVAGLMDALKPMGNL